MPLSDSDIRKVYGQRIRDARNAKGYSQLHFATLLGHRSFITPQAISRWEQGKATPRPSIRHEVARVLDLDVADLFAIPTGDDEAAA